MTRNEFINFIKRRIDRNKSLPLNLSNDELEDIIYQAKNWFYDNYNDSVYEFISLIPLELFQSEHFKQNKWVEFDECVYSVYEIFENRSGSFFVNRFYGRPGFIQHVIVNTMYYTKTLDIVTYVANLGYEQVLKNLNDNYISFSWEKNKRRAHLIGHTPRYDVVVKGFKKVEETTLFEDDLFQKYVEGQARIALGEVLSFYDVKLPGNITINASSLIERGESMIEAIKEDIKDINKPDWFITF